MPNKNSSVTITGSVELLLKMRRMGPMAVTAAAGSLYRSAEKVMTESKQNYVPVDTGALRASGKVLPPEVGNNQVTVTLGYGDESVGYAIHVHENPNAHHPVGQWKYLEVPARNAIPDIQQDLVDDIDDAFRSLA